MNWFLVAIMATIQVPLSQDIYVFTDPTFESSKQCLAYVRDNPKILTLKLMSEFPGDKLDQLLCVPEENVKKILETSMELDNNLDT